jgi:MFS family permease
MLFEPYFQGNNEAASVITNLFLVLSNLTILVTGFLTKSLTAKNFVIIGSLMTFAGLLLSSFAASLTQLIFTFPILIGIGLGLLNPAAFVAVLACFTCHRTFAISIGFAALGFGQLVMPVAVKQILIDFGAKEGLFMVSLLSIVGAVGAHFLVPITWKPCVRTELASEPLLPSKEESPSILKTIVRGADLDLLTSSKFMVITFGLCVVYASSSNFNIALPVYMVRKVFTFSSG